MTRRSVVVVAAATAVIAGLALLTGLVGPLATPVRFVYGAAATAPDTAALLTRNNAGPTRFWVEHVDLDGNLRWSAEVTPIDVADNLGHTSLTAVDDLVVLLGHSGPDIVARALDRASGEYRWHTILAGERGRLDTIGPMVIADSPRVYLLHTFGDDEHRQDRVDALALADGAHLWSYDTAPVSTIRLMKPGRLLVHDIRSAAATLDGATGKPVDTGALDRVACHVPGAIVTREGGQSVVFPDTGEPGWTAPNASHALGDICGLRGDDLVLPTHDLMTDARALTRRDLRTGAPRWSLDLGDLDLFSLVALDGRLPRMLPVTARDDAKGEQLVIVDLDAGKEIGRHPSPSQTTVLTTADRAFAWLRFEGVLMAFDPATGALADATALPDAQAALPTHDDLRHGVLWLPGRAHARPHALPWAAFDLTTGQLRHASGDIVGPVPTAELRKLGW